MLNIYIFLFFNCVLGNFGRTEVRIGSPCIVADSGAQGKCSAPKNCPASINDYYKVRDDTICGYIGNLEIVCCVNPLPETTTTTTTTEATTTATTEQPLRISAKKCNAYKNLVYHYVTTYDYARDQIIHKKVLNCDIVALPLILGGLNAASKEFPHMALIGHGKPGNIMWDCGGSLISERYVLSAAQCTRPLSSTVDGEPASKYVKLGELWLDSSREDAKPIVVDVSKEIPHPQFINYDAYYDIALFRLATDIQFNHYIRPLCLPQTFESGTSKVIATGWGDNGFDPFNFNMDNTKLLKVTLEYFTNKECKEIYVAGPKLKHGVNDSTQFCAGSHSGSKDTCNGDSGTPLQIYHSHPCMYEIVGITSFGSVICGRYPGVYTRVFPFLDWIESVVWSNEN